MINSQSKREPATAIPAIKLSRRERRQVRKIARVFDLAVSSR